MGAVSVRERIRLIDAVLIAYAPLCDEWVQLGLSAKGALEDAYSAGWEWGSGPMPILRFLRGLRHALQAIQQNGRPPLPELPVKRPNGQVSARVYPTNFYEKLSAPSTTAEKLWQSLGVEARDGLRLLDVACGPAPYSLALARKHSGVTLTWIDRAEILQTAGKAAASLGVTGQVTFLEGDMWAADFGSRVYDVAYLGNVTHFFSDEQNTRLFHKVQTALAPGGMIVVNSMVRREKSNAAWADLWLYAATVSGSAYDFFEYRAMLEEAGFTNVEDVDQGPIKAVKP